MRKLLFIFGLCILFSNVAKAQGEDLGDFEVQDEPRGYKLKIKLYRYKDPIIENGDTAWCYTWDPGVWIFAPLKFKNEKQRREFNRLVYNVKKVLPIAQRVNGLIAETYEVLEMLRRRVVELGVVRTPFAGQGKLLIKLVDRECNQNSYEIVKAFFGPTKATFYQIFAWTFHASLKKEYKPEDDDKLIERVVLLVENGQL